MKKIFFPLIVALLFLFSQNVSYGAEKIPVSATIWSAGSFCSACTQIQNYAQTAGVLGSTVQYQLASNAPPSANLRGAYPQMDVTYSDGSKARLQWEAGEKNMQDAINKIKANQSGTNQPNNPTTPGGGKNPNTKKCIVLTPGPSKEYGDFVGTVADDWITVFDSPVNCLGMGILFPKFEDPLNTKLRLAKKLPLFDYDWVSAGGCSIYYTDAQKSISALSLAKKSAGSEVAKIYIPTRADAEFYIANGLKGWKVPGGAIMEPSTSYLAGSKTAKDITDKNVKISENCLFEEMSGKEIQDLKDQVQDGNKEPFGGLGNNGSGGGSGGGGNGGGSLGGGLSGKLGQLLQGLLGGLGQGGNQNGQASPTPTPFICPTTSNYVCGSDNKTYINRCYAEFQGQVSVKHEGACNNSDTGNTVCSSAWQPVCGNDSKTYSNTCELKKVSGVTVAKQGVCADNASTGNISTLSALLKQATQSGVPSSVLESAIRTVTNLITSMLSNGAKNPSEVIVP